MKELNPVSKARLIVDGMTNNPFIASKLLTGITSNLTVEQINELYDELKTRCKQLKLNL